MDYKKAGEYWIEEEKTSVKLDRKSLEQEIETFISAHNTCALATADLSGHVRCTPIEYTYMDGCIWMLSEGGLKFRGLAENKNVCIAIYDNYTGFGGLGGMQITGTAEVIEPWSETYLALLAFKKLPADALKKMPVTLHLIRVMPESIDYLNSDLKKQGADSRQHWERGSFTASSGANQRKNAAYISEEGVAYGQTQKGSPNG